MIYQYMHIVHPLVTTNFRLLESKIIDGKVWTLLVGTNRSIFSESLYGRFIDTLGTSIRLMFPCQSC